MKKITKKLEKVLEQHKLWFETCGDRGVRANLRGACLEGANLRDAKLYGANLVGTILERKEQEQVSEQSF